MFGQNPIRIATAILLAIGSLAADVLRTRDGRLAVDLPAGWHAVRTTSTGPVRAHSADKAADAEVYGVAKADRTERSLKQWADGCRAASERNSKLTDRQIDELRPVTISGRPGYVYTVTGTLDGQRRVYVKSYVETDRHYVEVMCWTTPTHADAADSDFHYLADHVRDAVPASDLPTPP